MDNSTYIFIEILNNFSLLLLLFATVGYYFLFQKKGIKKFYAFIPVLRDYQLSIVAEREEDGRTYCMLYLFYNLCMLLPNDADIPPFLKTLDSILTSSLSLAVLFFSIRVNLGLCKEFHKSKKWVILLELFKSLSLIYWGLRKDFVPERRIGDIKEAKVSNAQVDKIENGLTLNLEERSAKKFFRKKVLLKDIHLSIPTGHMVLLLGGSGAGKTTFVNAATGYEKADAEVILSGQDVYKDYDQMKFDLGFAPQQDLMRDCDTVIMTLKDAASLRLPLDMPHADKEERVTTVLEMFGLAAVKHNLVSSLSGGQRKRLSIAMEFISDPTMFFLDEPDSGLDGVLARKLFTELRSIADEGKIVVVITHTPDRVIDLFDDVIVLAKDKTKTGRLAYYGPVKEAYTFFGKDSMEEILLSINPKDEGGEARADEFVEKYANELQRKAGQTA